MNRNLLLILVLVVCFCLGTGAAYAGDKYSGTPAARAEYARAQTAQRAQDYAEAIASYQKAVELDVNFAKAYGDLVRVQRLQIFREKTNRTEDENVVLGQKFDEEMRAKYVALAKEHPNNPIYPWVVGMIYNESHPDRQEQYCRKSIEIASDFTPGYECLARVAMLRGDSEHGAEYFRKVLVANPDDADRQLQYMYYVHTNPVQYKSAAEEVGKKFPHSPQAAEALYRYANSQTDPAVRQKALENLFDRYSPAKFDGSLSASKELFGMYDQTDPGKARALAHDMHEQLPNDNTWKQNAAYADAMAEAEQKIAAGDEAAALDLLNKLKIPNYPVNPIRWNLLRARARHHSGDTKGAYTDLLKTVALHPTGKERAALYDYGKQVGKTESQVRDELWKAISANAKPPISFSLESYVTGKKVSLDDYKGYVVIVDFWFPNCGPCMGSFPYLNDLITKYKDRGVVLLAINGVEGQAPFVLPLLKSKGYDAFIPLEGGEWCEKNNIHLFPTTFLVGTDGRIYFKPHVYDYEEERTAELMIEALLEQTAKAGANSPSP